jgi:hypothetical protein
MKTSLSTLAVMAVIGHAALAANMAAPAVTAAKANAATYSANAQVAWNLLAGSPSADFRNREFGQPSLQMGQPKAGQPSASYHGAR